MTQTGATISSNSLLGKIIFGRYLLERKVGQGGMAWVFLAKDMERDEPVAAKVLLPHIAESPDLRERFLREARIQAQLEHPNIVQLYDAGEEDGLIGIILEWVEGETLLDMLKRLEEPLPPLELHRLMVPVLEALGFAHKRQMVHRDIKPENIMLHWEDGVPIPKIADFGLAKILDEIGESQTKTGMIMGTLKYMAPEQVNATKSVDQRADIYSVGICMYTMATLHAPFSGSMQEMIVSILYDGVTDPRQFNPGLSDAVVDVILQTVARSPESRYQTCEECIEALTTAVGVSLGMGGAHDETVPMQVAVDFNAPFKVLLPPPQKTFEPLPSGAISGGSFSIDKPKRPSTKKNEQTAITDREPPPSPGRSPALLFSIVAVVMMLLGAGGFAVYRMSSAGSSQTPTKKKRKLPAGAECHKGDVRPCFTSRDGTKGPKGASKKGICRPGYQICVGGKFAPCIQAILPKKEECNGKDDDCDGKIDEDFSQKEKACSLPLGECKIAGKWQCAAGGDKLECVVLKKQPATKFPQVTLRIEPKDREFRIRLRRKWTIFKEKYCVVLKRWRMRVRIKGSGFYRCRFTLKRSKKTELLLKMKARSSRTLEPRRNYCSR